MEATPRGFYRGSVANGCRTVAKILYLVLLMTFMMFLSHGTQDLYPDFFGRGAQDFRNRSREYRDDL